MKSSPHAHYAVLTGDVVGSSRSGQTDRGELPALLRSASTSLRRAFSGAVPLSIDVFRGDSWQLLVNEPSKILAIAVYFRASIIASSLGGIRRDTRIAIAVGPVDFVPPRRVSEGNGPAYQRSGRDLDAMHEPQRMSFAWADDSGSEGNLGAVVRLLDALVQEWTAAQARAVIGRLEARTQAQIAQSWPKAISQQAVAKHLESAHWGAVGYALEQAEKSLAGL